MQVVDVPEVHAGPGEVRIRVHAAAVNPTDTVLRDGTSTHAEAMRTDSAGDMSSMPIHMADIGTDNYEQEFTLGLIESERAILQEIEDALHRMVDKTYGLCVGTGMPIGKKRLRANPWAKYSYEYKLAQEKGMMRRF